jgi:short-subunit dehydrogenase
LVTAKYEGRAFLDRFGPWAVIAGGSDGIGSAFADELASRGLNLALIARDEDKLSARAAQIRERFAVEVRHASIDLTSADVATQAGEFTADLDVGLFIYNAGSGRNMGPFLESGVENWMHQVHLSCGGPVRLAHHFGGRLCERGRGGLVLMSSLGSLSGSAYVTTYAASKSFDTIFAEGLWQEFAPKGVDVVGCLAGTTDTETFREDTGGMPEAMDPLDVAKETLDFLGRGPTFVPGATNRKRVRAMWPTPRIPLIQALSKANADNFELPFDVLEGEEFGDI